MTVPDAIHTALDARMGETLRALGGIAAARGDHLYAVGGAVRDILLGLEFSEVDLALEGDVAAFAADVEQTGLGRVTATSQFLTVKLVVDGEELDLATARREAYAAPGALPTVAPAPIAADLIRRDFSVNAIAVSLAPDTYGHVFDPQNGIADLHARTLRALHERSFQDDATRMLRAARYAARLGFAPDPVTESRMRRDSNYIRTISPDRLRHEFERVWREPAPERRLSLLAEWGVAAHLPGGRTTVERAAERLPLMHANAQPDAGISDSSWALWAAAAAPDAVADLTVTFNLQGAARRAVEEVSRWRERPDSSDPVAAARASDAVDILAGYSVPALIALSATERSQVADTIQRYLNEWRNVRPAMDGNAIIELGVPQGPMVGRYLDRLRRARLDGEAGSLSDERALMQGWLRHEPPATPD